MAANVKMRLIPLNFTYSRSFHVMFSALCKSIRRTTGFYIELAKTRDLIKKQGIEGVIEAVDKSGTLSYLAREYFDKMKSELPKVGLELQGRVMVYLFSLKDENHG